MPVRLPQPQFAPEQLPQGLLEALAVRYLVVSRDALKKPHLDMHRWRPLDTGPNAGSMEVWINSRAQPRAYLVPAARAVGSAEAAWEIGRCTELSTRAGPWCWRGVASGPLR